MNTCPLPTEAVLGEKVVLYDNISSLQVPLMQCLCGVPALLHGVTPLCYRHAMATQVWETQSVLWNTDYLTLTVWQSLGVIPRETVTAPYTVVRHPKIEERFGDLKYGMPQTKPWGFCRVAKEAKTPLTGLSPCMGPTITLLMSPVSFSSMVRKAEDQLKERLDKPFRPQFVSDLILHLSHSAQEEEDEALKAKTLSVTTCFAHFPQNLVYLGHQVDDADGRKAFSNGVSLLIAPCNSSPVDTPHFSCAPVRTETTLTPPKGPVITASQLLTALRNLAPDLVQESKADVGLPQWIKDAFNTGEN